MKLWVKMFIIVLCLTEIGVGVYVGFSLYKRKQRVLGATASVIDKGQNTKNSQSTLEYYYEPIGNWKEVDKTPWVKGAVTFTYNFDTFNDRFNYLLVKPATTYRIVALGDSFTFGDHVNTKDSWPEQLEDELNARKPCPTYTKYEVLNLGLRGFDIQDEVERFRLRGQKYHPDAVIWLLVWNDFDDVRELSTGRAIEIRAAMEANHTVDPNNPWDIPLAQAAKDFHARYTDEQLSKMQDGFFSAFNKLYSGRLLLSTFPYLKSAYKSHMQSWARSRPDTYYFDGLTNTAADPNLSVADGHPNVSGHTRIAEDYYTYLVNNNMIPCTTK